MEKKINETAEAWKDVGLTLPSILLPQSGVDLEKWATIACDQFSSEPAFWEKTASIVGESPSTLKIILPECYLEKQGREKRIETINKTMRGYLDNLLEPLPPGFIYVDRQTPHVQSRKGLLVGLDLEAYEFDQEANSLVRPTEETVLNRIPPRMGVRAKAVLDLPHVLVLVDDPQDKIFGLLEKKRSDLPLLYDTPLMQGGGRISGRQVNDPQILSSLLETLESLKQERPLLFVVGDGNHSLASAKTLWEEIKKQTNQTEHPFRYALVELENIHDRGLPFEPIHRLLTNVDLKEVIAFMESEGVRFQEVANEEELSTRLKGSAASPDHRVGLFFQGKRALLSKEDASIRLTITLFQELLDRYVKENAKAKIDYIHGLESLRTLSNKERAVGFFLEGISKNSFFDLIISEGTLPRKSFSIGEALEKRYYLESRSLMTP